MSAQPLLLPARQDICPFISPDHALKDAAKHRNVLTTGAGSGIGKTPADIFAKASASHIVLVGRDAKNLQTVQVELASRYPSTSIPAESCDVSSEESVDALFARLQDRDNAVDVLINNAGVAAEYTSIRDSDPTT